jgi:hypothetical protein
MRADSRYSRANPLHWPVPDPLKPAVAFGVGFGSLSDSVKERSHSVKRRRYLVFHSVMFCLLASLARVLIAPEPVAAAVRVREIIPADEARHHIGENSTVCGIVASARFLETSADKPTYLNLVRPYPNQAFTAVIPGPLRSQYRYRPEEFYKGKVICVCGVITANRDKPQIIIEDTFQIRVEQPVTPVTNQTVDSISPVADSTNQPTVSTSD